MRRRRQVFLISGAIVAVGLAAYLLWPKTPFSPGLTEENAFRLRPDMSMSETEAILGPHSERLAGKNGKFILVWRKGAASLTAMFPPGDDTLWTAVWSDEAGRATRVVPREDPLGRLRHQLNLP